MDNLTSRRKFLRIFGQTGLAGCIFPIFSRTSISGIGDRYNGLKTTRYLGKVRVETRISDTAVFTEGPAVDRIGQVYFTNVRTEKILKWDPKGKLLTVFSERTNQANGLRFLSNGELLICEGGSGKIVRMNVKSGQKTTVAEEYKGKGIQSPNDLDVDSQGRIYFTSRTDQPDPEKHNARSVYRIDPDGRIHQLLTEPRIHMPNGIVISPDKKTLYLIEAHPDQDHHRNILAFDLDQDGSLSNQRTLIDFYPGRSGDGMCIDREGNLYVAAGLHETRGTSETLDTRPGIHVISPAGKLVAFRETPEDTITNCTFGGKDLRTLYISCGTYLLSIRTRIPGKESYRPGG